MLHGVVSSCYQTPSLREVTSFLRLWWWIVVMECHNSTQSRPSSETKMYAIIVLYWAHNFNWMQRSYLTKKRFVSAGKEWEVLALNLGLSKGRVEALKTRNKQYPDRVKQDMLYTWVKRQPRSAEQVRLLVGTKICWTGTSDSWYQNQLNRLVMEMTKLKRRNKVWIISACY